MTTNNWDNWRKLCKETAVDPDKFEQICELFMSHDERVQMAQRVAIIDALLKGEQTQREIAKNLNVSIAKITRGSNEIKRTLGSTISLVKEILHKK